MKNQKSACISIICAYLLLYNHRSRSRFISSLDFLYKKSKIIINKNIFTKKFTLFKTQKATTHSSLIFYLIFFTQKIKIKLQTQTSICHIVQGENGFLLFNHKIFFFYIFITFFTCYYIFIATFNIFI